ncbi:MAG: glycoside hydrolase family 13 protein [Ruminococcaceae bacterium]|nr:glycoside hydrolase family 13 protein [Oscillospiraceae bacterium]
MRILFDSKSPLHKKPFGVLREGEGCSVSVHIPLHCKTTSVKIELFKEDGGFFAAFFLFHQNNQNDYEIWSGDFSLSCAGLYFYRFYITTQEGEFALFKEGERDTNMGAGALWQLSCIPQDFHTPDFFKGKVMYQIFPDRFFKWGDCDLKGKLEPYYIHSDTKDIPDFRPNESGEVKNCDFFGGNLNGIAKKLGYLKSLGVSVIYLNPIFKAYSNHRYDTADYKKIDEMLGSEQDFVAFCKKAHLFGIKVILDGVFSHTGSNSIYFNSAISDPNSPYREWYDFKDYPVDYTSWWGIRTLPCVNEMNDKYREFIIGGEDSVIAHWLSLGADGFRLDVADELPDEFIKELRTRLKEIKPDALLIGEVWEDASNKVSYSRRRKYFTDGELDSTMNYPFRSAIIDFVSGADNGGGFASQIMTIAENYPREVLFCLMNSLSTHDTPRILSVLSGVRAPATKDERATFTLSESELALAEARLKCAAFLQFVLPGMPCIYYGDEIGTQGFEDPFCRSFFDWERSEKNELREFYKKLCALRNKSEPLKQGDVFAEKYADGILRIERRLKNKKATAFVNCSDKGINVSAEGKPVLSLNAEHGKQITLDPLGFILFEK